MRYTPTNVEVVAFVALLATLGLSGTLEAQVDPSGSWRTLHTDHFRIHAKSELHSHALRAAREAERAYALLAEALGQPRGKVDLVLSDDVDFANGFASVVPSNRITVYLTPPGDAISTGNYDIWLRMVITHELAHIFHLDRTGGVWRALQTVFGRAPGLFPNTYQPVWVQEGIATYYESRYSLGGRVDGSFHDQLITAAAQDGRWPQPGDATFANRVWPVGNAPYAWGSRYWETQSAQNGDSVIAKFIGRTSRQLIPFNVSAPLKAAGYEPVQAGWDALQTRFESVGRKGEVIDDGLRSEPRIRMSEDGRLLAYRRNDGKTIEHVVVRDLESGTILSKRRANVIEGLVWVADTLYVAQFDFTSPVQIRSDVYRWSPSGEWSRLGHGERHTDVFAAPDGGIGRITLADGGRRLTSGEGDNHMPMASDWGRVGLSPDERWFAAARHRDGHWNIVMWPVGDPTHLVSVTNDGAFVSHPVWSPDGSAIVFSSERERIPQVYAYRIATRTLEKHTDEPSGAREPALAADGSLYYSTLRGNGYAVVRLPQPRPVETQLARDVPFPAPPRAPTPEIREGGYAPLAGLRPHYWLPVWHDEESSGFFLGAVSSGNDVIGRTAYSAFATVAPATGRWEAALSAIHSRWRSWSLDATGGQTWDFAGSVIASDSARVPVSVRERSAEVGVSYRWRRWRRFTGVRLGGFLERDEFLSDDGPLPFTMANPLFAGGVISASIGHVDTPDFAISAENGFMASALYLRRWEIGGANWSWETRAAVNGYLAAALPGFSRWVLATRVTLGVTGGTRPNFYNLGGESGDPVALVPGYTLGSGRRTFALRGYDRSAELFTRAYVGVVELRLPVLLVGRGIWTLPLLLDRFSFSVFGEIGDGWRAGERPEFAALADVGGELVVDFGIGAGFPLRMRLGVAVPLTDGLGASAGDVRAYVAFGPSF